MSGLMVAIAAVELAAGVILLVQLGEVRALQVKVRAQLAETTALRRALEDPEIPAGIAACLRDHSAELAVMSAGGRMAGQLLADGLRCTLQVPDSVLAIALHVVRHAAEQIIEATPGRPDEARFGMLVRTITAASVDLASLELETEPAP